MNATQTAATSPRPPHRARALVVRLGMASSAFVPPTAALAQQDQSNLALVAAQQQEFDQGLALEDDMAAPAAKGMSTDQTTRVLGAVSTYAIKMGLLQPGESFVLPKGPYATGMMNMARGKPATAPVSDLPTDLAAKGQDIARAVVVQVALNATEAVSKLGDTPAALAAAQKDIAAQQGLKTEIQSIMKAGGPK